MTPRADREIYLIDTKYLDTDTCLIGAKDFDTKTSINSKPIIQALKSEMIYNRKENGSSTWRQKESKAWAKMALFKHQGMIGKK